MAFIVQSVVPPDKCIGEQFDVPLKISNTLQLDTVLETLRRPAIVVPAEYIPFTGLPEPLVILQLSIKLLLLPPNEEDA